MIGRYIRSKGPQRKRFSIWHCDRSQWEKNGWLARYRVHYASVTSAPRAAPYRAFSCAFRSARCAIRPSRPRWRTSLPKLLR